MKVIFLDHDGVICLSSNWGGRSKKWAKYRSANPESSRDMGQAPVEYRFDDFDKKAIKVLNEILEETGAEIVVSSDWRKHYTLRQMRDVMIEYGIYGPLIDITTHQNLWNRMSGPSLEWERASQVVKWAKDNKISNWISIDDLKLNQEYKWMKPRIPMWRHVQVDGDWGFGGRLRDKIDECIAKLNK